MPRFVCLFVFICCYLIVVLANSGPNTANCTPTNVQNCSSRELPECETGVSPIWNDEECCYDCKPRIEPSSCNKDTSQIPLCQENVNPSLDQYNCPTCQPRNGRVGAENCTKQDFENCLPTFNALPPCNQNGGEIRRAGCCLSCRFPQDPFCSQNLLEDCDLENLPDCEINEVPRWNRTSCCRTCKRPSPSVPCTNELIRSCFARAPICEDGEIPVPRGCCRSCVPPDVKCDRVVTARCRATNRLCASNERPVLIRGECCPTCRLPPPTCAPSCANDQICIRDENENNVCRPRFSIRRILRRIANADLTCDELVELIRTILERYCSINRSSNQQAACEQLKRYLRFLYLEKCERTDNGDYDFELAGPVRNPSGGSRQENEFAQFLEDALSDSVATGGLEFDQATDSSATTLSFTFFFIAFSFFMLI